MRRPAGVVVAAVILGILSVTGILLSVLVFGVSILVRTPIVPNLPAVRFTMAAIAALILAFFLFCAWTVSGLIRLRPAARYAMLFISGLQFLVCAVLCAGTLLVRSYAPPLPPSPTAMNLQIVLIGTAAMYGLLSLIGAFWLVYFNLSEVRAAFAPPGPTGAKEEAVRVQSKVEASVSSISSHPPESQSGI